jgi:hypothetical protein
MKNIAFVTKTHTRYEELHQTGCVLSFALRF